MRLRFLGGSPLLCPFCLAEMVAGWQGDTCPVCHREQPRQYLQNAGALKPLPVQTIGWSGHGKSVFLAGLTMLLTKMQVVWKQYTWLAGSDETYRAVEEILGHLEAGTVPPSTPLDHDLPFLLLLRGMGRWAGRALVYRDCAGEHFNGLAIPVERVPFLLKARTIFLIASPADLEQRRTRTVDMLLQGYLSTLAKHRVDPAVDRRRVVVVLTKGDVNRDSLPPQFRKYLDDDGVWGTLDEGRRNLQFSDGDVTRYLAEMATVDRELRRWVQTSAAGQHLVRLAEDARVDLRFSLVSATGGPVNGTVLERRWDPQRVLDVLLWALDFDSPPLRITSPAPPDPPRRRFFVRRTSE